MDFRVVDLLKKMRVARNIEEQTRKAKHEDVKRKMKRHSTTTNRENDLVDVTFRGLLTNLKDVMKRADYYVYASDSTLKMASVHTELCSGLKWVPPLVDGVLLDSQISWSLTRIPSIKKKKAQLKLLPRRQKIGRLKRRKYPNELRQRVHPQMISRLLRIAALSHRYRRQGMSICSCCNLAKLSDSSASSLIVSLCSSSTFRICCPVSSPRRSPLMLPERKSPSWASILRPQMA